jgi:predicted phosphoadenosine phosphosulfate sulfurtransferase
MSGSKHYLPIDVFTAAQQRVAQCFDDFENVVVAFSAGKDSSATLHLALAEARKRNRLPLDVMFVDLEAQYQHSIDYAMRIAKLPDVRMHWICLPIHLRNAVSQIQPHWLCWDPDAADRWVRPLPNHPSVISEEAHFPFFRRGMEFEEFVPQFNQWLADSRDGKTVTLVGIRTDESLNRFRTIKSEEKVRWKDFGWTTRYSDNCYNAYPIYDWHVEDIWAAHGKSGWDYNRVYDLMQMAGLTLHQMRLCQPFGDDQRRGLWLYKMLEPETWSRVVGRVQGANFGNRYVELTGNVMGNIRVTLPEGHTWKSYTKFLLATMPPPTAAHYREKIFKHMYWWWKNGREKHGIGMIVDAADPKLEAKKLTVSWRRIAKCILKNDYWCKSLTFSPTKRQMEKHLALVSYYMENL